MMKTTKVVFAVMMALTASALAATTVSVSDVTARQRYPWNGLVDITCTVSGIDGETNGLNLAVSAVMPDTGRARYVSHFKVERGGKWSDAREVRTNGAYRLLWDAAADLGPVRFTNMAVRVFFDPHSKVQLWEGGPYWATTNIGAEKPEEYGLYFWWGDTVGYKRKGSAWVASDGSSQNFSFSSGNTPTCKKSNATLANEGWITTDGVLAPEHDAAQVKWGGGWRMPTYQELYDLCFIKCDWTWTTQSGVKGYVVQGRGAYSNASIFLPCAGCGYGTSLVDAGSRGNYWSSVPYSDNNNYSANLFFGSDLHSVDYYGNRGIVRSVRPVQGFAE